MMTRDQNTLLGKHGDDQAEAAWKQQIDAMIDRAFGGWRVVGAGSVRAISMPYQHTLEVTQTP